MNEKEFVKNCSDLGLEATDYQLELLRKYYEYLVSENNKYNLTSIISLDDVYLKHFYDSLTVIKGIDLTKINTLLDIGTGAGFPGIVLKIFFPNINITLLDSNHKKTEFLNNLKLLLSLENCEVVTARSEEYAIKFRDEFDVVIARAVSELRVISELAIPLVKKNGIFVAMKGRISSEIEESSFLFQALKSKISKIESFLLPNGDVRNIIYVKKEEITPKKYPRRYDQIIKKRLK